jgi:D-tyrosyl-tRNA(Tyr) deacylase
MRAVVQRVGEAWVSVNGRRVGEIEQGLLVYLGIHASDRIADADYLVEKILGLRVFEDPAEKMNLCLAQVHGALLVVSQFTLYGDCRKGKRPSFSEAAAPEKARELYDYFVLRCNKEGIKTETGTFREMMRVGSVNAGPVTLLLDSHKRF